MNKRQKKKRKKKIETELWKIICDIDVTVKLEELFDSTNLEQGYYEFSRKNKRSRKVC